MRQAEERSEPPSLSGRGRGGGSEPVTRKRQEPGRGRVRDCSGLRASAKRPPCRGVQDNAAPAAREPWRRGSDASGAEALALSISSERQMGCGEVRKLCTPPPVYPPSRTLQYVREGNAPLRRGAFSPTLPKVLEPSGGNGQVRPWLRNRPTVDDANGSAGFALEWHGICRYNKALNVSPALARGGCRPSKRRGACACRVLFSRVSMRSCR